MTFQALVDARGAFLTIVNKALLKALGFQGHVMNYGKHGYPAEPLA